MNIVLNGESTEVEAGTTIGVVIDRVTHDRSRVAVERNRKIVPRATFDETAVAERYSTLVVVPIAAAVRPAMDHDVGHGANVVRERIKGAAMQRIREAQWPVRDGDGNDCSQTEQRAKHDDAERTASEASPLDKH